MKSHSKNALFLTGAAARISQEVACVDQLIEKKGLTFSEDDTVLAGFSSGSLNLLAINVCFRNTNPLSWDDFYKKEILWKLSNDKVYTKNDFGIPIFNTSPLRKTLNSFLSSGDIKWMGNLDFESYVLTFSDRHLATEWAVNFGAKNQSALNASDLFMASTAIPVVFPNQEIEDNDSANRNFPNGHFSDGGTGGQFKNFEDHIGKYVLNNGPFETLHIVSPMREEGEAELKQLHEGLHGSSFKELEKEELGRLASYLSFSSFLKFLESIQEWEKENGPIANEVFVSIPRLDQNFGILDFDVEQQQYQSVVDWLNRNPEELAVPLNEFVAKHLAV